MAKTEKAGSFEGAVTITPTAIERLQSIAQQIEDYNINNIRHANQISLEKEVAAFKGKSSAAKKADAISESKQMSDIEIETWVDTQWTVSYSDDSTTRDLDASEVLSLTNMNNRQIVGLNLNGSGRAKTGGVDFRFNARGDQGLSRISVSVEGPDDQVTVYFDRLGEIAASLINNSLTRRYRFFLIRVYLYGTGILGGVAIAEFLNSGYVPSQRVAMFYLIGLFAVLALSVWFKGIYEYFSPAWVCTIGDGNIRAEKYAKRRKNLETYGFVTIVLGLVVSVVGYFITQKIAEWQQSLL